MSDRLTHAPWCEMGIFVTLKCVLPMHASSSPLPFVCCIKPTSLIELRSNYMQLLNQPLHFSCHKERLWFGQFLSPKAVPPAIWKLVLENWRTPGGKFALQLWEGEIATLRSSATGEHDAALVAIRYDLCNVVFSFHINLALLLTIYFGNSIEELTEPNDFVDGNILETSLIKLNKSNHDLQVLQLLSLAHSWWWGGTKWKRM